MTNSEYLRARLYKQAGLNNFKDLQQSEWSPEFEQMMRNRLIMGALRYGPLFEKKANPGTWDLVGAMSKKLTAYRRSGNVELLVDIANYCLLEYECGNHPLRHFRATDDEDHCERKA